MKGEDENLVGQLNPRRATPIPTPNPNATLTPTLTPTPNPSRIPNPYPDPNLLGQLDPLRV